MKIILSFLFLSLTVACHAEKNSQHECQFGPSNIELTTPKADNIINSSWVKDSDGYESIDRLYVNYKDGSVAIIEHKYCSMYNFEIAYYARDKSSFADAEKIAATLGTLLSYSAIKDDTIGSALTDIKEKLKGKKFNSSQAVTADVNESNSDNQQVEYSVSYLPLEDSSLHKAALFFYMGIGGEH
jgi:hypothetical protein